MELLTAVKDFYQRLKDFHLIEEVPNYEVIDDIAEKVYQGNYKELDKYIIVTLAPEYYSALKEARETIVHIVDEDK